MDPNQFVHKHLSDYIHKRIDLLGRRKKALERQVNYLQTQRKSGVKIENYLSKIRSLKKSLKRINLEIKFTNTKSEAENTDAIVGEARKVASPNAARRWHSKYSSIKSPVWRFQNITDWEVKRDEKAEASGNKDREWAIEKLIKRGLTKEQITSLNPWVDYLKTENLTNEFRVFILRNLLKLEIGMNGKMRNRGKKSTANFPKFEIDTINRVIPTMLDFMANDDYALLNTEVAGISEEDSKKIYSVLEGNTSSQRNKFAEAFELIDEATKPKEYKDISDEYEIKVFRRRDDLEKTAKIVADLCKNSKSFCIRGVGMAKQYLESGDLWIMTRMGTNVKTGEREPVPDMAIFIQTVGGYHVNEIHGNEENQDLHPRNVLLIKTVLKELWEMEQISDVEEKTKISIKRRSNKPNDLERALFYYFCSRGFRENTRETRKLDNVLMLAKIEEKINKYPESGEDLDIEELKFIYGLSGDTSTFSQGPNKLEKLKFERDKNLGRKHSGPSGELRNLIEQYKKEDYAKIFECKVEEIQIGKSLHFGNLSNIISVNEIPLDTKIYVGNARGLYLGGKLEKIVGTLILENEKEIEWYKERNIEILGSVIIDKKMQN